MVKMTHLVAAALVTPMVNTASFAGIFDRADELFFQRNKGYEASTQARKEYEKTLQKNLTTEDKVYAVVQMARLDIYRGSMIPSASQSQKEDALEACIDTIELIANTNSQEYHYNRLVCIGSRGKIASTLGRIKWANKMRIAQGPALESTKINGVYVGGFESGGILRAMSALRGNRKAKLLGLYNAQEALEFAQVALASEGSVYRPFPDHMSGHDFYENFYYLAQAKVAVGIEDEKLASVKEGKDVLVDTINTLSELEEAGELPKGREPETKHYKGLMQELQSNIQACEGQSNWRSCLISKLDD